MRGGAYYYNHAVKALSEIGVATNYGSHGPDLAIVHLDAVYRPAKTLCWQRDTGWKLTFDGRAWGDEIPIGPPDMTPGKAARACARLLTQQAQLQADAVKTAVYEALGEPVEQRLGWESVGNLRQKIIAALDADVLAAVQDGDERG